MRAAIFRRLFPNAMEQSILTLVAALERHAGQLGRSLLTMDTRTGDKAEPLYAALRYQTAGIIPGYCRDPFKDCLDPTTLMYKAL